MTHSDLYPNLEEEKNISSVSALSILAGQEDKIWGKPASNRINKLSPPGNPTCDFFERSNILVKYHFQISFSNVIVKYHRQISSSKTNIKWNILLSFPCQAWIYALFLFNWKYTLTFLLALLFCFHSIWHSNVRKKTNNKD